jgi:hypothetical protein
VIGRLLDHDFWSIFIGGCSDRRRDHRRYPEILQKVGRTVQLTELVKSTKISRLAIRTHFGNYTETLRACGLEGQGYGIG